MHDWFEHLTGFRETDWASTRARLELDGTQLRSRVNGARFDTGRLETPTLAELRQRASLGRTRVAGRLETGLTIGDAGSLHAARANAGALFQVASQFNLLEMTGPDVTPEHGVGIYAFDHTQGPACAITAGAATIYRNYFAPVDMGGRPGQTRDRQIDCLRDLGDALGNRDGSLWSMRNGYALCSETGLARIDAQLQGLDEAGRDELRARLRIGLHWDVQVTAAPPPWPRVSQAFCSALPVAYRPFARERWQSFATLVLEGAYEATLRAGLLNAARGASPAVYLTLLGGGAFGNDAAWILAALRRALQRMRDVALQVRIVSYREPADDLRDLVSELS